MVLPQSEHWREYEQASQLAVTGDLPAAAERYKQLEALELDPGLRALLRNDLAVLGFASGNSVVGSEFGAIVASNPTCAAAAQNLAFVQSRRPHATDPIRVAVLSFLFNWPSQGGGIVHTIELARFLGRAGYDVQHLYVRNIPWGVGLVESPLDFASQPIDFGPDDWNASTIRARVRAAVDAYQPDYVIVTDSWSTKPFLADAVQGYPTILRLQAQECLCPLNGVRLLRGRQGQLEQCPSHQFADPDRCHRCLAEHGRESGDLHRAERELVGVGTPEYGALLRRTFREALAVLVVNPLQEAMLSPYARTVRVVTSGFDPARFRRARPQRSSDRLVIFSAVNVHEPMKGFSVLHDACRRLWQHRQDFELVVTGEPAGRFDEFTRFVGWLTQEDLPRQFEAADLCVVPAIAQEALGRTAVEAMAAGCPVVATRIGGFPFTVSDGATGLLAEPNDPADLAAKMERLLDSPDLRRRLGAGGRARFEEHYTWDAIIAKHYRPLLCQRRARNTGTRDRTREDALVRELAEAFPWPAAPPDVPIPTEHIGWLADGAHECLTRELGEDSRIVVELGAWLGLSTRLIADTAVDARIICIDHWLGGPEHTRPDWNAMLPGLFETFLAMNWAYRHRIIPLRMSVRSGLRAIAERGLSPDLIYFDADQRFEPLCGDLGLALELFPRATLVGDDWQAPEVAQAVAVVAQRHGRAVQTYGRDWKAWRLTTHGAGDG